MLAMLSSLYTAHLPQPNNRMKERMRMLAMLTTSLFFLIGELASADDHTLWPVFQQWLSKHPRDYYYHNVNSHDDDEQLILLRRFSIFCENLQYIEERNSALRTSSYRLGLTKFADLTHHEFKLLYLRPLNRSLTAAEAAATTTTRRMPKIHMPRASFEASIPLEIPSSIDWRELGAVTPVKDQGTCGSCWAFSTIAAIEGINQIVSGELVSLSEQELVDCDVEKNLGCNGGLMSWAFDFILQNGGIDSEKDYPYQGDEGFCDVSKMNKHIVSIDGYYNVSSNDEQALLRAVAQQPISVVIDAGGRDFQHYVEGVFNGDCSTDLNHAVTVVGYGTDEKEKSNYWIVKNSWGGEWGESGYVRMQRGGGGWLHSKGMCGINMMPSYPVKKNLGLSSTIIL